MRIKKESLRNLGVNYYVGEEKDTCKLFLCKEEKNGHDVMHLYRVKFIEVNKKDLTARNVEVYVLAQGEEEAESQASCLCSGSKNEHLEMNEVETKQVDLMIRGWSSHIF